MSDQNDKIYVGWTVNGNIAVDDEAKDEPRMEIRFFEPWDKLSFEKKVRLVRALLDTLPLPQASADARTP